ncbi:hypothetical protein HW49_03005 [Porphyromonadaceae bacterium COT-184 OH4590]|nr:hypothetical protein HW49_03005 [Porphyromonadaceae bacterium COT-184 OH4590]MDO4726552.1 cell division protein ZapA [Porphyromonadaceae bacterium]
MENIEKQNISVKVAGNVFPLEIIGSQEEFYRIAEHIFKQKVEYYEKKYTDSTRNAIVAMAGYDITVCFLRYINSIDNSEEIRELEGFL